MVAKKRRVAVLHLDLGIGGGEQLTVLSSLALSRMPGKGCEKDPNVDLTIYTTRHDPSYAFKPTVDGSLNVKVCGNFIPSSIFGVGIAFCSSIRMIYLCLYLLFSAFLDCKSLSSLSNYYDVIYNDQVSMVNPLLKLMTHKLIFYCHFPDKLLSHRTYSGISKLYRDTFNYLEEFGMKYADLVFVNSIFTRQAYMGCFPSFEESKHLPPTVRYPEVLYPPVDLEQIPPKEESIECLKKANIPIISEDLEVPVFISINRYARSKNLTLALRAFEVLGKKYEIEDNTCLIMSGGYDKYLRENIEHFDELVSEAKSLDLTTFIDSKKIYESTNKNSTQVVIFLRNIGDDFRWSLLRRCCGTIYTPENEHFGIVPCESMSVGTPVIASDTGGPMESIVNEVTGYLCSHNASEFASAMNNLLEIRRDPKKKKVWEYACEERVKSLFSFEMFSKKLRSFAFTSSNKDNKMIELISGEVVAPKKRKGKNPHSS
ncbi:alpha-1,3-mannoyltransferase protein, putative [Cryptosporidium muris RN66]|uniref:Alpha-1,3/1,6-mannosyltransferase ALG2 n=1 Tax=Cryptosporidium muris (strain RN66) TaxID=441375 RepID=B6AFW3_CRYMR|nr:alpha-1,3-mannoyltransferase protein, putative [Cryptosporidium muris RN66]EEA07104.1 alpha-1,3-mannoyltransferase protein, putative [Cryptosporidium muris RN66]|eukprot:XP_002141453.1 alpha-1,3-mannoyltransferase protein [Cryptosporidium muris RN66]